MLLFARSRSDAVKRFLVDDGNGKDARFWKLAQSLSALYPPGTDEKRWVMACSPGRRGSGYDIHVAQHSTLIGDPRCTQEYRSRIFGESGRSRSMDFAESI